MTPNAPSPLSYARYLAGYIKDPSTIHVMTKREWGRAPTVEECRRIRSNVEALRQNEINVMIARATPDREKDVPDEFVCGHPRDMDNVAFQGDKEICRTCLDRKRKSLIWQRYTNRREAQRTADIEAVKRVADLDLSGIVSPARRAIVCAARLFGVTVDEVVGTSRKPKFVRARWAVMLALNALGADRYPLPRIASSLGLKDHSTVHYGIRQGRIEIERNPDFAEQVSRVTGAALMQPKPVNPEIVNRYLREPELTV